MTASTEELDEFQDLYRSLTPGTGGSAAEPVRFIPYDGTLFRAEHALRDGQLVFHFYKPAGSLAFWDVLHVQGSLRTTNFLTAYWNVRFPDALDHCARSHFRAEHPRLVASHVQEADKEVEFNGTVLPLDSWWMVAKGFGSLPLLDEMVARFYRVLEEGLISRNLT